MNNKSITIISMLFAVTASQAQTYHTKPSQAYAQMSASLVKQYKSRLAELMPAPVPADSLVDSVILSPSFYRLLGPGVYYKSAILDRFSVDSSFLSDSTSYKRSLLMRTSKNASDTYASCLSRSIDDVLVDGYVNNPSLFRFTDDRIAKEEIIKDVKPTGKNKLDDLEQIYKKAEQIKDVSQVVQGVDVDLRINKPNFWTTKCNFKLQFSQNYFSETWYRGGNNNVNLYSNLYIEANYNDQQSVQWDNKLDMRLGFITATSDSIHNFLTNNDRLYLFSKLGVKAIQNWYYSLSAEAQTQFMPGYRSNDRRKYSDFMAPLDVFVGLGVDFKPKMKNGNSLSAVISPLTYKFRYIASNEEKIHASYNMRNRDFKQDFGSKVEANTYFTLAKNFTWRSRYYFFTSYEYVESEWENVFSFRFNKYITSEVNTIWRFDDNRDKRYVDSTLGYFQFKENFSLGLSYNF